MVKVTSPEQFIASSPIGERIKDVFENSLAEGALRLVTINGEERQLRKLGNNEAKVAESLESGYFGILHTNPDFIKTEIENLIINKEDVPESYFQLQQRIDRERGCGDVVFTEDVKDEAIVMLQDDQAESLTEWADYLRSEENGHIYPDWFKVYAWESLRKMGDFDKEKGEFKKRTKSTTAPWPELNAEALAYVYDAIDTSVIGGGPSEGRLQQLLKAGNFAKLYAHAITEVGVGGSPELREITKGSWVKYDQIEGRYAPNYQRADGEYTDDEFVDNPTVIALTDSLRGMGTGWYTAGTRTAAHQLSMGDFYVYYTRDAAGNDTLPRIAIRMENGVVAEVRGIEPDQNLEGNMTDIVAEKLKTLPGGDEYFEKVENMKRLTEIDERVKAGGELTADDIIFLRFSGKIEGFGWDVDPRISELLEGRNPDDDLRIVLQEHTNPTEFATRLMDSGHSYIAANNLDAFLNAGADPTEFATRLMDAEKGYAVADDLSTFLSAGANPTELATRLIDSGYGPDVADDLSTFLSAGANPTELATRLMDSGYGPSVAYNLSTFLSAGANPTELATWLMDSDYAPGVANNLSTFLNAGADIDPTELATRLIDSGHSYIIANNLSTFLNAGADIDPTELATRLIDSGHSYIIADNLDTLLNAGADRDYLEAMLKSKE